MKEKYTIDCNMHCNSCSIQFEPKEYCEFTGTKAQVKAFIKRHFKQPKIKKVVGK